MISQVFTIGQEALTILLMVAAPMLLVILVVGLVIGGPAGRHATS